MKNLVIYSAAEFKALNDKRVCYNQWNELSITELMNLFSGVVRQLTFKFESPYNTSRAKRNEAFKQVFDPVVESIETMAQLNEQMRSDISAFYDYVKQANANDSSERNAEIDNGAVQTKQPNSIDSTQSNLINRLEFLTKRLEAMGIDAKAEENTPEAIEQVEEAIQKVA